MAAAAVVLRDHHTHPNYRRVRASLADSPLERYGLSTTRSLLLRSVQQSARHTLAREHDLRHSVSVLVCHLSADHVVHSPTLEQSIVGGTTAAKPRPARRSTDLPAHQHPLRAGHSGHDVPLHLLHHRQRAAAHLSSDLDWRRDRRGSVECGDDLHHLTATKDPPQAFVSEQNHTGDTTTSTETQHIAPVTSI